MTPARLLPALLALAAVATFTPAQPPAPEAKAFAADGVAFLKKHCLSCHGDTRPKADLSLTKYTTAESMLKDRKVWQRVQDVIHGGEMPPESRPRPTGAESDAFLKTVGGIFDHHDRTAPPDPGRVTMRRLNRLEYNNTVRDLVGIDFTPADDFPSDDVGHGFDNIGDVLTLPPVLLERYLAAAESIMDRAILLKVPAVPRRYLSARFLQPASNDITAKTGRFRLLNPTDADPKVSGPYFAPAEYLKLSATDDIIVRANLYAVPKGPSPVKVALILDGGKLADPSPAAEVKKLMGAGLVKAGPVKVLQVFDVTARDDKKVQQIEFRLNRRGDAQRAGVAVVRPPAGEEPPQVFVEHIWSEGPMETRPPSHRKLLACDESKPPAEKTREVLARFATHAYRRPVTPDELNRLVKLAESRTVAGESWEAGVQFAMTAVLVSPKFLFRVELDDRPEGPNARPIGEYQLASRLSYFLWASMPDAELFELAAKNQLTPNLPAQVKRMLADPKANTLVESFAMQWLQLQPLRNAQPDAKLFPQFNDRLRAAMFQETKLFLGEIVRQDRSVLDILDADYTYVNADLARLYGLKKAGGRPEEFVRVALAGTNRGGVLTQASVLTVTSNPTRTSPVKRGRWVLEQLLGTPPPPPPPNVPELEEAGKKTTALTLRARMEEHRKNPACASCHAKMDPLGFGLENFDAVGAFRAKDGDAPIDPSGELPGGVKFAGPVELKKILLSKKDLFARCLAEKLLTYGIGRGLEFSDKRAVDKIVAGLTRQDYKFSALVTEVVQSDPFRMRRGSVAK